MFLKSLTLRGFKSFAERTVIDLEPGITVIVGPNGSGKSNIVDALAWVFGTQGPKQLRGQKMEDVIFVGTPQRAPLGRAEVGITIDNSAGLIPVDASEITISRLLFRSGESEYAINGAPCRLLDIQELLSDTGVGRQLHVLVGQGQIDSVLLSRPQDRRAVIEEAAGVLKHRRRKERALRRLEAMELNLQRLSDLSRELRRQLRPLERQAEAARRHAELVGELEALQRFLAGRELTALRARAAQAALQRTELEERHAERRRHRDDLETRIAAGGETMTLLGRDLEAAREIEARLRSLDERLSSLARLATERARNAALRIEALADDPISELSSEIEEARAIEHAAESELTVATLRKEEIEAELLALTHRRSALAEMAKGTRSAELRAELAALDDAARRSEDEAGRLAAHAAQVADAITRRVAERDQLRTEIERLDASSTPLADDLARAGAARLRVREEVQSLDERRRRAETHVSRLRGDKEARLAAITEAEAGSTGRRAHAAAPFALGVLGDLVLADEGLSAAVASALDVDALAVAGDPEATFSTVKDEGVAAARVLNISIGISAADAGGEPGQLDDATRLLDIVRAAPGVQAATIDTYLKRALARTYLCETWRAATALARVHPGCKFVTREGDLVQSDSAWRVGGEELPSILSRARVDELEDALRVAERELRETASLLERRSNELLSLVEDEDAVREALHQADAVLTSTADRLARVDAELADLRGQDELLRAHREELEMRRAADLRRRRAVEAELPKLEGEESDRARLEEEAREVDEAILRLEADRSELEVRAGALGERVASACSRREAASHRLAEAQESHAGRRAAERRAADVRDSAEAVARRAAQAADVAAGRAVSATEARAALAERVAAAGRNLDADRGALTVTSHELDGFVERLRRAEIAEAEVRLRLETAEQARAELGANDGIEAGEPPDGLSPEEVPVRIRHLRDDITRLGPINPLALEEYDAILERYEFLTSQLDDVRASRRELEKVIAAVDAKIIEIFRAAYGDVSRHFGEIFGRLFPGGAGRLTLSDPSDLLECGVEVEARPAGKRIDKLSLLSGGERSLAALAFLFAVFRARPSPFYVLDEVEAALDDVNLHRFVQLLDEFREEAQLLVVTHQKRTMECADCLYGVTMRDDGTTLVISQRMSDLDALVLSPEGHSPR